MVDPTALSPEAKKNWLHRQFLLAESNQQVTHDH